MPTSPSHLTCRSTHIHNDFDLSDPSVIEGYLDTILNFLNYLLYHDVCPEYAAQIERAREMCKTGRIELTSIARLLPLLPGTFNKACSKFCGGFYEPQSNADLDWLDDAQKLMPDLDDANQKDLDVLRAGLQAFAVEKQVMVPEVLSAEEKHPALAVAHEAQQNLEVTTIVVGSSSLGTFYARPWHNPSAEIEDWSEDEETPTSLPEPVFEFWLENDLLHHMFVGMKLEIGMKTLDCGFRYFDAVYAVNCSFYTYLPNEMVVGWRKVEENWLPPASPQADGLVATENGDAVSADDST